MLGNFIVFLIAAIGLTHLIIDGSILSKFRGYIKSFNISWLSELISCYQCCGTHVGFWLVFIYNPLTLPWYQSVFICAFASSFASMLGAALLNHLDRPWGGQSET